MDELDEIRALLATERVSVGSSTGAPRLAALSPANGMRALDGPPRLDPGRVAKLLGRARALYGADDRAEAIDSPSPASGAVCVLVRTTKLARIEGGVRFEAPSFGERYRLCADQRFFDQPWLGYGTGFLIAPRLVVTAGHCIDGIPLDEIRLFFDYEVRDGSVRRERLDSEMWSVSSVRHVVVGPSDDVDFAVIELDRDVVGASPLTLRSSPIDVGAPVYVVGHPVGLPKKVARGAHVLSRSSENAFLADLDAFGGNSGSPVLDTNDEVCGILVAGAEDFVWQGDCVVATTFPLDSTGEKVCCVSAWADRVS